MRFSLQCKPKLTVSHIHGRLGLSWELTIFIPCTAPYSTLSATSLYTLLVFLLTVEETEALPICGV
jgi:hypothetical protein